MSLIKDKRGESVPNPLRVIKVAASLRRFVISPRTNVLAGIYSLPFRRKRIGSALTRSRVAGILLSASSIASAAGTLDVVIREAGYYGEDTNEDTLAWVVDRRLLFMSPGPIGSREKSALYIWEIQAGSVAKRVELGDSAGFCYSENSIRYWYRSEGAVAHFSGQLGDEGRVVAKADKAVRKGARLNRLDCSFAPKSSYPKAEAIFLYPLRKKDGYLGYPISRGENETFYLRSVGEQPASLNLSARAVPLTYSGCINAYILREASAITVRSESIPVRFWTFAPPARVESISVPPGPWLRGTIAAVGPVATGFAFTSLAVGPVDREGRLTAGASGLYVMNKALPTRAIPGYAHSMSVAPSGCDVALNITPHVGGEQHPRIKLVRLCARGSK